MDDRIIDFNELKNKVKDKDVDKFEDYMYTLYYKMAEGKLTMADFSKEIFKYMEENNISQDKFFKMQKKLMERYGLDTGMFDEQLKSAGIDLNISNDYESMRKNMSFQEKYKDRLKNEGIMIYEIKNDKNELEIYIKSEEVLILSQKKVDLTDLELNEFICSYKKVKETAQLKVRICESIQEYQY